LERHGSSVTIRIVICRGARFGWVVLLPVALVAVACSSSDSGGARARDAGGDVAFDAPRDAGGETSHDAAADATRDVAGDASGDAEAASPCPADMVAVGTFCIDRYEAPNRAGAQPLVMYTFDEADAWCTARGKRLCFDDEWTLACQGPTASAYPYGNTYEPGECNDDKTWIAYDQSKLDLWPWNLPASQIDSLPALLAAVRAEGPNTSIAADEVERLYQGTPSGAKPGCGGAYGVFDLVGNAEEWTRRRDGGTTSFHGSLKGRYWAESRTCQSAVTTHGDGFRFYEIGFRCCKDP
jgi:Sulfatase-modifying factor enzyme 1